MLWEVIDRCTGLRTQPPYSQGAAWTHAVHSAGMRSVLYEEQEESEDGWCQSSLLMNNVASGFRVGLSIICGC